MPPPVLIVDMPVEINGDEITITQGDRRYRIRGLGKNLSHDMLKVNVLAIARRAIHVDTLDLNVGPAAGGVHQAGGGRAGGRREEVIRKDLGRVFLQLESAAERADPQSARTERRGSANSARKRKPRRSSCSRIRICSTGFSMTLPAAASSARRRISSSAILPPSRGGWKRRLPWWCSRVRPPARAC